MYTARARARVTREPWAAMGGFACTTHRKMHMRPAQRASEHQASGHAGRRTEAGTDRAPERRTYTHTQRDGATNTERDRQTPDDARGTDKSTRRRCQACMMGTNNMQAVNTWMTHADRTKVGTVETWYATVRLACDNNRAQAEHTLTYLPRQCRRGIAPAAPGQRTTAKGQ